MQRAARLHQQYPSSDAESERKRTPKQMDPRADRDLQWRFLGRPPRRRGHRDYTAISRRCVISDGAPNRNGGPQYPVPRLT